MADQAEHEVTAQPVEKLRSGIIGYRFVCSCGRVGNGHHRTPEKAIERGHDHVPGAGEVEVIPTLGEVMDDLDRAGEHDG